METVKSIIVQLLAASKLSGVRLWIAQKILQYGGQILMDNLQLAWSKIVKKSEDKKAKEELDKVLNDPNSTVEQRAEAYEKFVNSSHK